jgi:hypothetical protein
MLSDSFILILLSDKQIGNNCWQISFSSFSLFSFSKTPKMASGDEHISIVITHKSRMEMTHEKVLLETTRDF